MDGPNSLRGRDYLCVEDLDDVELRRVLDLAAGLKTMQRERRPHLLLAGRSLAMIFERSSTRTRVSFQVGMQQLGGSAIALTASEMQLGRGESLADTGRVLSRYVDAIVLRTGPHERLVELAEAAAVPVVNALTERHHPCQALADVLTLQERLGELEGKRLAWFGDGANNVCRSLTTAATRLGMRVAIASPPGFQPPEEALAAAGGEVMVTDDPAAAADGAHAIATDVWTSMGQDDDRERRLRELAPYRVGAALTAAADHAHVVLHCLPAHPGEEITDEVLYGPRSAVWDEAENRLHSQKALLALLLG